MLFSFSFQIFFDKVNRRRVISLVGISTDSALERGHIFARQIFTSNEVEEKLWTDFLYYLTPDFSIRNQIVDLCSFIIL